MSLEKLEYTPSLTATKMSGRPSSVVCSAVIMCSYVLAACAYIGEGAPDYAALYENRTIKPLQFPTPIPTLSPFKVDPKTGYVLHGHQIVH